MNSSYNSAGKHTPSRKAKFSFVHNYSPLHKLEGKSYFLNLYVSYLPGSTKKFEIQTRELQRIEGLHTVSQVERISESKALCIDGKSKQVFELTYHSFNKVWKAKEFQCKTFFNFSYEEHRS